MSEALPVVAWAWGEGKRMDAVSAETKAGAPHYYAPYSFPLTSHREATARIAALEERVREMEEDARRYRFLRDVATGGDWEHIGQTCCPGDTDSAVDELMSFASEDGEELQ